MGGWLSCNLGLIPRTGLWRHTGLSSWPLKKQKLGDQHYKLTFPLCQLQPQVGYMMSYPKITGWKLDQNIRVCPTSVEIQTLMLHAGAFVKLRVTYLFSVYVCASRHGYEGQRTACCESVLLPPGNRTQVICLGGQHPYLLSHSPNHPPKKGLYLFSFSMFHVSTCFCTCVAACLYMSTCVHGRCWDLTITLPPYLLRQGISIKPRACWYGPCHCPACSGDPLTPSFEAGIPGGSSPSCPLSIYVAFWESEFPSSPKASTLTAEPSPQSLL